MTDESKAIEAIANTVGKGIDAGRELGSFLSKYTGGTVEQSLGILEDKLKYIRWERQIRLYERAGTFLKARGLDKPNRPVPLQVALPLIQAGSLEEDNNMQDRWASLLANAADANTNTEVRRSFISILEDLTSLDAQIVEMIYALPNISEVSQEIWTTQLPRYLSLDRPSQEDIRPPKYIEVSLGNIARLGLITSAMAWGGSAVFSCVHQTPLGQEFLKAISNPHTSP